MHQEKEDVACMKQIIATPSRTKELLDTYQLRAKKNYGQNFLIEPGVVDKIARHALISDHCAVVEIGPGIGALTQYLCEYAQRVIAYEIDARLPAVLADSLSAYDNFELRMQDFLSVDIQELVNDLRQEGYDVVFAANLPYYITTPILFHLFEANCEIGAITVMMQKEVADRFHARCNTKEYNALSVMTQYRCDITPIMKIPRNVFMPRPQVDSAVLQFRFKPKQENIDEARLFALIKACFKQRRKTILNNYGAYVGNKDQAKELLEKAAIDPSVRSESLNLNDFFRLYEVMQQ